MALTDMERLAIKSLMVMIKQKAAEISQIGLVPEDFNFLAQMDKQVNLDKLVMFCMRDLPFIPAFTEETASGFILGSLIGYAVGLKDTLPATDFTDWDMDDINGQQ